MNWKKLIKWLLGIVIVLGALWWGADFVKHQTIFTTLVTIGFVVVAFIAGMWFKAWLARRTRKEPRYPVNGKN